jgi:hypothetical protein
MCLDPMDIHLHGHTLAFPSVHVWQPGHKLIASMGNHFRGDIVGFPGTLVSRQSASLVIPRTTFCMKIFYHFQMSPLRSSPRSTFIPLTAKLKDSLQHFQVAMLSSNLARVPMHWKFLSIPGTCNSSVDMGFWVTREKVHFSSFSKLRKFVPIRICSDCCVLEHIRIPKKIRSEFEFVPI